MTQTPFRQINNLEDDVFIAGTSKTYVFNVYDETGVPLNLAGASVYWLLSYYAQPDAFLMSKTGTITGTSEFQITLAPADTEGLYGKFLHQPVVIDSTGDEFRPAQGIITIIPGLKFV